MLLIKVLVKTGKPSVTRDGARIIVTTTKERKNNRANFDVIKQISIFMGVPLDRIKIVQGFSSKNKTISISESRYDRI